MTSNARLARIATFHARSGHADSLLERLLLVVEATGATRFSILEALDLAQDTDLLGGRLRPGRSQGWAHRHGVAEEI